VTIFSNAFDHRLAVAILRIAEGLDCLGSGGSGSAEDDQQLVQSSYDLAGNTLMHADSDLSMSGRGIARVQSVPTIGELRRPPRQTGQEPTCIKDIYHRISFTRSHVFSLSLSLSL
jgi:hypothetical protein